MVADHGSTLPGRATPSLAVRTDVLEQKPWAGYQDLKGLRIALQAPASIETYLLEQMLVRGGLQASDVEIVATLPFADMVVAFNNKAIEASMFNEPWATQLEQMGVIKKVVYADDIANVHISGLLYSETFAQNTPAARNFMVAYLRGVRDSWDADDGRRDFQHVVDVIKTHTALKDEALIRQVPPTGQNPNGHLDAAKLAAYQDWLADRGLVTQKADIEKAYDPSFVDYANGVLGPYRPVESPRRPS
jgi:NitT/TauT family transport system substrate-binding protein